MAGIKISLAEDLSLLLKIGEDVLTIEYDVTFFPTTSEVGDGIIADDELRFHELLT